MTAKSMEELVSLAKRRGFIFNRDIYGGLQGVYDYGPLGVELKNNLKAAWWRAMVYERDDIEGLDAAIRCPLTLQHSGRRLYRSAGGLPALAKPLVRRPLRKHVSRMRLQRSDGTSPFQSDAGTCRRPVQDGRQFQPDLRPRDRLRRLPPTGRTSWIPPLQGHYAGIAQIGKAFRNEVSLRFIFRASGCTNCFHRVEEDERWRNGGLIHRRRESNRGIVLEAGA